MCYPLIPLMITIRTRGHGDAKQVDTSAAIPKSHYYVPCAHRVMPLFNNVAHPMQPARSTGTSVARNLIVGHASKEKCRRAHPGLGNDAQNQKCVHLYATSSKKPT